MKVTIWTVIIGLILVVLFCWAFPANAVIFISGTSSGGGGGVSPIEDYSTGSSAGEDDSDQLLIWAFHATPTAHSPSLYHDDNTTSAINGGEDLLVDTLPVCGGAALATTSSGRISLAWKMMIDASATANGPLSGLGLDWDTGTTTCEFGMLCEVRWYYASGTYDVALWYAGTLGDTQDVNIPRGSTFYMRLDYDAGTGADAEYGLYYATTQPSSAATSGGAGEWTTIIEYTGASSTQIADYVRVYSHGISGFSFHIDDIVYDSTGAGVHW